MPLIRIRYTPAAGELAGFEDYIDEQNLDLRTMERLPWDNVFPAVATNLTVITFRQRPHVGLQAIIAREDLNRQTMEELSRNGVFPLSRNAPIVGLQAITFRQGPYVGLQAIIAGTDLDEKTMEALPWSPQTRIVNMLFGGNTAPEEAYE
jgi:hypothetical protein